MIVWRLNRRKYADRTVAFNGAGAAKLGQRWNARDVPVAYASGSRALAVLEYLVHISRENAPTDLVFVSASFHDSEVEYADVPAGWNAIGSLEAEEYGTKWANEARSLVLAVPSIVVPGETNFLINPRQPRFE